MRCAGELFAWLSGGRMGGLTVVTTEPKPYIMGVLADGREVPVDGMSAGQRHQLFLALRLASLERLVELSRATQVVLFTHQDHLAAMAREVVPADLLVEREVGDERRPVLRAA